jgi:hypothetical protein
MRFKIVATCENGHIGETFYDGLERQQVEVQAGLLDGTSPFYMFPPRLYAPESTLIGKCGICSAWFNCRVEEVGEGKI